MKILLLLVAALPLRANMATVTGPIDYSNGRHAVFLQKTGRYNLYSSHWRVIQRNLTLGQLRWQAGV